MGERGPRPEPTILKVLRGNPGRRPLNADEPQPELLSDDPAPPAWLGEHGATKWCELVPQLRTLGVLTAIDLGALASYCWCYSEFRWADAFLKDHGRIMTLRNDKGEVKYRQPTPEAAMAKNMIAEMRRYEQEFGLTPSSRSGVKVAGGTKAASAVPVRKRG